MHVNPPVYSLSVVPTSVLVFGQDEEIQSWKDLFGIKERNIAKCCAKNDGKAWLQQIIEKYANHGQTKEEMISRSSGLPTGHPSTVPISSKSPSS